MKPGVPLLDDARFDAAVQAVYHERAGFEFLLVAKILSTFRNAYCAMPPADVADKSNPQPEQHCPDADNGAVTNEHPNRDHPLPPN